VGGESIVQNTLDLIITSTEFISLQY